MRRASRRASARLSVVAAAAALVVSMLGVTAAQAAAPTITSFTPTSGVIGSTVTITGTGFKDTSVVTSVAFNGVAATSFTVDSDTQITVVVPSGATTGKISVTDSEGTDTSGPNFTVTASPTPTITSFTPTSGAVGTTVTVTGTGFTGASAVTVGGTAVTTFTVDSDTQITLTVPAGATTGAIAVTTPGGTATSTTDFTVTTGVTRHGRSVTLSLRHHLVARGRVRSGFHACEAHVTVRIQRRGDAGWRTIARDRTSASGAYRRSISDREGVYRALVPRQSVNGGADICRRDVSPRRSHHHA
jgi:IPT/TIG domain-containing protein